MRTWKQCGWFNVVGLLLLARLRALFHTQDILWLYFAYTETIEHIYESLIFLTEYLCTATATATATSAESERGVMGAGKYTQMQRVARKRSSGINGTCRVPASH